MSRYVANQADYWGNIRGEWGIFALKCPEITRAFSLYFLLSLYCRVLDFRRAKDNWLNPAGMYKNIRVPCILSQKSWVASRTSRGRAFHDLLWRFSNPKANPSRDKIQCYRTVNTILDCITFPISPLDANTFESESLLVLSSLISLSLSLTRLRTH